VFYAPGLAEWTTPVCRHALAADCVMVDGTFWTDDEMIRLGLSSKTRPRHRPPGPERPRRHDRTAGPPAPAHPQASLIHINNTNPILDEGSTERAILSAAGIEVATTAWRSLWTM
jgi:pyrroloquinoline quinone biosynthesis protein B